MQSNNIILLLLITFCFSCKNNTEETYKPKETNFKLSTFSWLRGTWVGNSAKDSTSFTESWATDSNGNWAGRGLMLFGKDTVNETIGIYKEEDRVYYTAKVEGQNYGGTTRFLLSDTANGQYVFSDDEHDFPQVIIYKQTSPNNFEATLKGIKHGRFQTNIYKFERKN
ncbi:MAG: DUF6265 family protein [Bacteroidota bacterium]|nr:DUF6265 family protein [Bacteroidota bacterium]